MNSERLEPGKPLERKLNGGETHSFEFQLSQGQFIHLVAEQRGIDIALALFGPDGRWIGEANNKQTERGFEAISLIGDVSGTYRIEVRSARKTTPSGTYQLVIERLQDAGGADRSLAAAEQLIANGNKLLKAQTKESLSQAIARYQEALPAFEAGGDLLSKAVVLNKIGRAYFSLGEYRKALDYHHQALPLARAVSDHQAQAATLTYIGDAYRLLTENEKALDCLNQSIQIWGLIQDRRGELEALNIIARVYWRIGEVHRALLFYDRALDMTRVLSDQSGEITTLNGMAMAYYVVGENEKASELWKQALALARSERGRGMEMVVLSCLGGVSNALGQWPEALAYLDQAIALARGLGSPTDEAGALQTKGRVYRSMGEPKKSIEYLEQSLVVLKDVNNPQPGLARGHYNLGKAYTDLGEYQKAVDYLNLALLVWKSGSDPINIAATIREIARAERGRGNLETALAQSEAAINQMEWIRTQAGGPELRASYLALVQDCFELRIDVLMRLHQRYPSKGYAAAALQASERGRARSLLETLAEAGVDIRRGVNPDLLKREQATAKDLSIKASEQARLMGTKPDEVALTQIGKEIRDLSARYERIEEEIRTASPQYADLMRPQPLTLAEIREQVIDDKSMLLEYSLGQERSYLWAVTSTSIDSYELPKREVIETAARRVYELLTARNRRLKFETIEERRARVAKADGDYADAAKSLSAIVLKPVSAQLANQRLLIVSDGALQYVPFAALPTPASNGSSYFTPLALNHEVVGLPSASTLAVLRRELAMRKPAPMTIAMLADPVFDANDERVKGSRARNKPLTPSAALASARAATISRSEIDRSAAESGWGGESANLARLPFTRREAAAIKALVPAAYRKTDLDFSASVANAKSPELSQYRIVHFATHGFLNSRHPELSGVVLSLVNEEGKEQDGFLKAHEINDLKLPAELVVLSGCRTGLGKEIKGEGLVGLTRAFMHAGSARVLVSLWDVNDEATAELITRFYSRLLGREKLSPAAALCAAQISMAHDKRWSSPYYWAGFTLQGEPR